jgi:hypothetical protein
MMPSDWTRPLSAVSAERVTEPVWSTFIAHALLVQTNPPTQSLSALHDPLQAVPEQIKDFGQVIAAGF